MQRGVMSYKNLQKLLKDHHLKAIDLAEILFRSKDSNERSKVSRLFSGERTLKPEEAFKLSAVFNVPVSYLYDKSEVTSSVAAYRSDVMEDIIAIVIEKFWELRLAPEPNDIGRAACRYYERYMAAYNNDPPIKDDRRNMELQVIISESLKNINANVAKI